MASKTKTPSASEMNLNLMKAEALKKIVEHNRDYLKLDLTLPLGDKALKQVHTNQWLFTDLPKEFDLANWTILAEALNSNVNRWEGYVENRWYIESVDISVEAGGKAEMKLGLNAFASSYRNFIDDAKSFQKAYTDALNQQQTSASKNTSNATSNKTSVINDKWVKKYKVPDVVVNKIKSICKVSNTDEANVKAWFNWMNSNIGYAKYSDHKRTPEQVFSNKSGNCVDNSRVFRLGCLAMGIKCNFMKGLNCCAETCANHQWNKVYIGKKGIEVDVGRSNASWGSHWGNCKGSETSTSW